MKIALLGYGRMGQEIEKIATSRGHEIVIRKDAGDSIDITKADVAIDISPAARIFLAITFFIFCLHISSSHQKAHTCVLFAMR